MGGRGARVRVCAVAPFALGALLACTSSLRRSGPSFRAYAERAAEVQRRELDAGATPAEANRADASSAAQPRDPAETVAPVAAAGTHLWSRQIGGTSERIRGHAGAVAVEPDGSVVLVAEHEGPMDFGAGPLRSLRARRRREQGRLVALARFDADGNYRSARLIDNACGTFGHGLRVASLPTGGVVVAGTGSECRTSCDEQHTCVVAYDAAGELRWSLRMFGTGIRAPSLATGADGSIALAAEWTPGVTDAGRGVIGEARAGYGPRRTFVALYGPDGAARWVHVAAGIVPSVAFTPRGDALYLDVSMTGGGTHLVRVDPSGAVQSEVSLSPRPLPYPWESRIAVGNDGSILLGTIASGTLELGRAHTRFPGDGTHAVVVARFTPQGALRWVRRAGEGLGLEDLSVGGQRQVVALARVLQEQRSTAVLYAFSPEGTALFTRRLPDTCCQDSVAVMSMQADRAGTLVLSGVFHGAVDFGGGALRSVPEAPDDDPPRAPDFWNPPFEAPPRQRFVPALFIARYGL